MSGTAKISEPIKRRYLLWFFASLLVLTFATISARRLWSPAKRQGREVVASQPDPEEPIQPITPATGLDPQKVVLGGKLFYDPRLSHNNQMSCASCHSLRTGGTDRRVRPVGMSGAIGIINTPTVLNSGFNFSQFWDGRADSLESQISEPIQAKTEMASTWPEVIAKLGRSDEYAAAFHGIYEDGIQIDHIKDSIATFEPSLSTPNCRFDQYLRHHREAISSSEREGYELFKSVGCSSCHQGVNIGGNMYQKLGIMAPYFTDRGHITRADNGRFNVTGDAHDMYMFKVPSLRNVELTAPYFHDGSAATLEDAVRTMAKYQLGHHLSDHEVDLVTAFLKTLTGELKQPAL